jgi:transcription antitermination factor NusG
VNNEAKCARWFAVHVRPNHEMMVSTLLRYKGYEEFVPMRKKSTRNSKPKNEREVERPLFPSYVFVRCEWEPRFRSTHIPPVLTTPGVIRIVGCGSMPEPIPDEEILMLRTIHSSGLVTRPWPYLDIGQVVSIVSGPLCGLQGILTSKERVHRIVVSVRLLQRSVAVEVDRCSIASGLLPMVPAGRQISTAI